LHYKQIYSNFIEYFQKKKTDRVEMKTNLTENARRAAAAISGADALLITAGAGMGVDSGLPDFRGNEGFWKAYPPMKKLGKSFYDMANPSWFRDDPLVAWGFYGHRLNLYRKTVPHKGFKMLLEIGRGKNHGYFVFTSNVDGQFQKAGFDSSGIAECHGSIHYLQCSRPCTSTIWDGKDTEISVNDETFIAYEPVPLCPECGSAARPNILMFGDYAWVSERTDRQEEALDQWLSGIIVQNSRVAIIELGAGEAVATVRKASEVISSRMKSPLIRINPRDNNVPSKNDIAIPAGALEGISAICLEMENL
jgi:NAD-dependent SIR2 family protein deacetylase